MAKKISQLTQATEVKSDDVTVIVQDGETKKLPLNTLVTKQDIENKKVSGLAKLDEIEATYENDTYTPTITVKNKSSVKTGEGDEVDYSANVMDGHVKSAILKGQTLVNIFDVSTSDRIDSAVTVLVDVNKVTVEGKWYTSFRMNLKPSTKYTLFVEYETEGRSVVIGDYTNANSKILLNLQVQSAGSKGIYTFTSNDTGSMNGLLLYASNGNAVYKNIMVLEGDMTNEDIPYFEGMQSVKMPVLTTSNSDSSKTNILTVNEDVTLRSNGDVCDELNLLTGRLTQRIDENNEVLAQEVVKTVDLMPSGTHPSTTPYCWKNGHIQLSSSGLLPNLEYSVVTSRAGQINQNATMIVKNDKRIFDLEILLAGGLVNTTYQALTLQNQVETGLSKVSLNSETEPDYLLYHMIMKLIEEKAYKLDDLTEKVSVFYLYEKLSDEQFETIYSALYPFVEDEIVEEPVVEELPEVVEDEVIM